MIGGVRTQLALQRLTSPALPVGAFSYSRGLEQAVECGWVKGEDTARRWIEGVLTHGLGPLDGAVFVRLFRAYASADGQSAMRWCSHLAAARESRELQDEERNMGAALVRLLRDLALIEEGELDRDCGFVAAFAVATLRSRIALEPALAGFLWTFCEAQVSAAIRLVPLGQTAGQRILLAMETVIARVTEDTLALSDDDIGNALPGLAMASAAHETQYCRLFRS